MDTTSLTYTLLQAMFAVQPITMDVSAEYQYSPNISQAEACQRAEDKAKTIALQKAYGQDFGSDSTMTCKEDATHTCSSIKNVYENTRGYILSVERQKETVENWSCKVSVKVKMKEPKARPHSIEAQARLNRVVYTRDDKIAVTVETAKSGMVTVYKYDPIADVATKVFPLPGVQGNLWTYELQPLTVTLPAKSFQERDEPYYLLVTVSGGPLSALNQYRLHEYYHMYDNIPYSDVTLIRKSFYVSRSKQ